MVVPALATEAPVLMADLVEQLLRLCRAELASVRAALADPALATRIDAQSTALGRRIDSLDDEELRAEELEVLRRAVDEALSTALRAPA